MSAVVVLLASATIQAQSLNLKTPAQNFISELKAIFPLVVLGIFIVCAFFNLGHFLKGDWKSAFGNILLYGVMVSVIVGIATWIASLTI